MAPDVMSDHSGRGCRAGGMVWLGVCCVAAFGPQGMFGQDGVCDPSLKPPAGGSPYAYQLRGDRCEGVYAREVAGTTLLVASFTREFEDFGASIPALLKVRWTSPSGKPVRVRAYSLRSQLYYQMDTVRAAGGGSYVWPSNVLAGLGLRRSDVGIVARTPAQVGDTERELYLPLRVGAAKQAAAPRFDLTLLSDQELVEVYIALTALGADGRAGRVLRANSALGHGFYPAQRGIHISLPEVTGRGFYRLAAGATLRSGGSATIQIWFYHDGT